MGGELPDDAEVRGLRPFGEPGQLQVLVHALTKRDAHEWVLSKRREEKPSGNPLCQRHRRMSPERRRPRKMSERRRRVLRGKACRSSCREAAYLNSDFGPDPLTWSPLTWRLFGLRVYGTKITDAGLKDLKLAVPRLDIYTTPW